MVSSRTNMEIRSETFFIHSRIHDGINFREEIYIQSNRSDPKGDEWFNLKERRSQIYR